MLTRQIKRQLTITNQCKLLARSIMYGVQLLQPFGLIAHFAGQIGHQNRLDVNGPVLRSCHFGMLHISPFPNVDRLDNCFRFGLRQVYMQQTVFHQGLAHFDAVRQHKTALELAACDSTV